MMTKEICQTCDEYIVNDKCNCCGLCDHIKGGVEEDCPCGREEKHIEGKGRHPRCKCECHGWR
jgi:hypothetical protein